jgi:hypothetical protein
LLPSISLVYPLFEAGNPVLEFVCFYRSREAFDKAA